VRHLDNVGKGLKFLLDRGGEQQGDQEHQSAGVAPSSPSPSSPTSERDIFKKACKTISLSSLKVFNVLRLVVIDNVSLASMKSHNDTNIFSNPLSKPTENS
jgi:hypothetical protein